MTDLYRDRSIPSRRPVGFVHPYLAVMAQLEAHRAVGGNVERFLGVVARERGESFADVLRFALSEREAKPFRIGRPCRE